MAEQKLDDDKSLLCNLKLSEADFYVRKVDNSDLEVNILFTANISTNKEEDKIDVHIYTKYNFDTCTKVSDMYDFFGEHGDISQVKNNVCQETPYEMNACARVTCS